ncbi:MAG: hypothetical protein ACYS99_20005 [Planctomycetota bacterium]|jgi:hypothetical protein
MIRTSRRAKIPKTLAYPVGAAAVSEALRGVRQYADLSIVFALPFGFSVSEILGATSMPVFRAGLFPPGPYKKGHVIWHLYVYPVPRQLSARLRELLTAGGLATVRDWLHKDRPKPWYAGSRRWIQLDYDASSDELISSQA